MLYKKSSGGRRFVVSSAEQDDRKVREGISWKTYCSVAKVWSPVLQCFQSRYLFVDLMCSLLAYNGKVHAHRHENGPRSGSRNGFSDSHGREIEIARLALFQRLSTPPQRCTGAARIRQCSY
jgi:hypothetical protein